MIFCGTAIPLQPPDLSGKAICVLAVRVELRRAHTYSGLVASTASPVNPSEYER